VVLLDAAQELIDPVSLQVTDAELDRLLRGLLDPPRSHRVTVILTTRRCPEALMAVQRSAQRRLPLDEGLSTPHAENLLRALDSGGEVGLKSASEDELEAVRRRTGGNPFALEMLYALLKNDPTTSLSKLLADTEQMTPAQVADDFLAREAIAVLDATERAVVEALAIYQIQVRAGAVNYLLQPHLGEVDSGPALDHLAGTQLVRLTGEHYQLPQKYWTFALDRVPFGTPGAPEAESAYTQVALLHRAADWFKDVSWPPEAWQDFGDLTPQLYQLRLLVRAQDYDNAAELLLEISPHVLRWGHARELLEAHRGLVDKLDDPDLAQQNMGSLGIILFDLRRYDEAIDCYRQAIELAEPLEDPMAANRWVLNEGSAYYQLGQTEQALRSYQEALQAAETAEERDEQRWALAGIALCESDLGRFDLALRHAEEALGIVRDLEDPLPEDSVLETEILAYLGNFHGQLGRHELATRQLNRALKRARGEGYRHAEIQCLTDLAELRVDVGEYQDAAKLARRVLELNQEVLGEAQLAREAGYVLALANLCDGAEPEARMAIDQASAYRPTRWTQPARDLQGIVMLRQHDTEAAREAFREAIEEAEALRRGGGECFFALDALGLARLGMACCGEEEQGGQAAAVFWDARALTRADGVVHRLGLLLDQLALADQHALVEAIRPYAEGVASSPPLGWTAPGPRPDRSREPVT
jgi:tetratricopeptide (TPR) repeat protein